jgi:hypothetical protein
VVEPVILLVLILACVITLSGGFIVGVTFGVVWERARRDAGRIAPHEALRPLYDAGEWGWP